MKKTIAIGIIALQHGRELLSRYAGEAGVLPGTTIMVPTDCWGVLVAGDQATAVFDIGPHDLQLPQFNRQPSGLLYTVGQEQHTVEWYPTGSPFRRALTMKVGDPLKFVQEMVVRRSADTLGRVVDALRPHFDAMIPPGQIQQNLEQSKAAIHQSLGHVGLMLLDLLEATAVAPSVPQAQPPPLPGQGAPQGGAPASPHEATAQVNAQAIGSHFSAVWASSSMDLFGKGELTLRIRLIGRPEASFNPAGPFSYDATLDFFSPDDWLAERVWQDLPPEQMRFTGLCGDHYYRAFIVAEERDKGSVDPLGNLEWELGQPTHGERESNPTQGGKRGQYVKLRVRFE